MSYPRPGGEHKWGIALLCYNRPHKRTNARRPERPSVNFCKENRRNQSGLQTQADSWGVTRRG